MNKRFRELLEEAERIRATGNRELHAQQVILTIYFGQEEGLLSGKVLAGTASDENFALTTEIGAGCLEFDTNERVGSVLELSRAEQIELNCRAVRAVGEHAEQSPDRN